MNTAVYERFTIDDKFGFDSAYLHRQEADDAAGNLAKRHGVPVHVYDRMAHFGAWQLWTIFPDGELIYDKRRLLRARGAEGKE